LKPPKTDPKTPPKTSKTTEKTPTLTNLTTPNTIPTDPKQFGEYFEYTTTEKHPDEPAKIICRCYIDSDYSIDDLKSANVLEFLSSNNFWVTASRYSTLTEATVGWFLGTVPDATNRDEFTSRHLARINDAAEDDPNLGTNNEQFTPVSTKNKKAKTLDTVTETAYNCP